MSDIEDDYLSDKFLVSSVSTTSAPKTYAQIRKEAERRARLKKEQNKTKSRRQRELESREEALSKSLFDRAKEEEDAGISSGNKALSIMMKMGFKPGQSLGKTADGEVLDQIANPRPVPPLSQHSESDKVPKSPVESTEPQTHHKTQPLPLNEWIGKKGIGLGKRGPSPTSAERVAKMAKMADETIHRDYRDRARQEYEERRAEGKLEPAQQTCITLDESTGKTFNVLWLNPRNPESFPKGLMDALTLHTSLVIPMHRERPDDTYESRLRRQMQADALRPLTSTDDGTATSTMKKSPITDHVFSSEILEEASQFLRLDAQDRLETILSYLRDKYAYCFWCGTRYSDDEEMADQCPGPDEDSHD